MLTYGVGTHTNRCRQPMERACTLRKTPSHNVPKYSVINCKRCHANRCYKHILSTYHIHSAQALKAHLTDTTSTRWHNLHQEMKDMYTKNYPQLRAAVRDGSNYALSHRLAYYASNFASTTPLNQAVTLGFYDAPAAGITVVSFPPFPNIATYFCLHSDTIRYSKLPHFAAPGQDMHQSDQLRG